MIHRCESHYGNWHYKESRMGGHSGGNTLIWNYNYGVQNFGNGSCSGKNTGFWGGFGLGLGAALGNWLMGGMQQFGGYMGNMMNSWMPSFSNFSNMFQPLDFSSLWEGFTFTMPEPPAKVEKKTKNEPSTPETPQTEAPDPQDLTSGTPDEPTILEDITIKNENNPARNGGGSSSSSSSVIPASNTLRGDGIVLSIPSASITANGAGNRRILSMDEINEIYKKKQGEYFEKYKTKHAVIIELFVDCYGDVKVKVRDYGPNCTEAILKEKQQGLVTEYENNYKSVHSECGGDQNMLAQIRHSYGAILIFN